MEYTVMKVNDKQTTNYNRLTVMRNTTRLVDIVNPSSKDVETYNKKYPLAIATCVYPNEIRFYI